MIVEVLAHGGGGGAEDLIAGATLMVFPIAIATGVLGGLRLARKQDRSNDRAPAGDPRDPREV